MARVDGPFAAWLRGARGAVNSRIALARRERPALDTVDLAALLTGPVAAAVGAVTTAAPERVAAVADALLDAALASAGRPHGALVRQALGEVLPAASRLLAADPAGAAATAVNGALVLARDGDVDPARWLAALAAAAPYAPDVPAWRDAGVLAAWRFGRAHYRAAALARLRDLPEPLALAAVQLPGPRAALVATLAAPWPATAPRLAARVGGFVGFGGRFARPPRLAVAGDALLAGDGARWFRLHADVFGATLTPAAAPASPSAPRPDRDRAAAARAACAVGAEAGVAHAGHLVAVTVPYSHDVLVVAGA